MRRTASLGLVLSSALSGTTAALFSPTDFVPLLGPSFLSNFDPTSTGPIREAVDAFPKTIDSLFENGSLNKTDLIIDVDVFSAATNESLYSYRHVGEGQEVTLTAGLLNDTTIAKIGSVSKLFTTYAIIAKAGIEIFSHPITKYIPELACNSTSNSSNGTPLDHIRWADVTVGALASHQAGSGGATQLLYDNINDVASITPDREWDSISMAFYEQVIDEFFHAYLELWEYMCTKPPVTTPFRTAVYSDGGYAILTQVLARIAGKEYGAAIQEILFDPLGLEGMSDKAPSGPGINVIDRRSIDNATSWASEIPIVAGSGGLHASSADLRAAGLSILNSELLSAATTQRWMKPLSGTGSLVELVGAPWEIERLALPATPGSNRMRISDLYTKAGGNGDYNAIFGLSPDHGIGFSILVTGLTSATARFVIRDALGEVFMPAAEAAAAENAINNLAGTFVSDTSEGTNMTICVEEGAAGLVMESFYLEGVDSGLLLVNTLAGAAPTNFTLHFFPTGPNSYSRSLSAQYKTNGTTRLAHRLVHSATEVPLAPRSFAEGGMGGLFDDQHSWEDIAFGLAPDNFVFTIEDVKLTSIEGVDLQLTFKRVD